MSCNWISRENFLKKNLTRLKISFRGFVRYRTLVVNYREIIRELRAQLGHDITVERFNEGRGHTVKFLVFTNNERLHNASQEKRRYLVLAASYYVEYFFKRKHPGIYVPFQEKFKEEYKILQKLSEHGLAPEGIFLSDKYYVREYVEGIPLSELLESGEAMVGLEGGEFVIKSLERIQKIHSLGVVHKDPMPSNVIVTNEGEIKFIDFEVFERMVGKSEEMARAFDFYRLLNEALLLYGGDKVDLCREGIEVVRDLASEPVVRKFLQLMKEKEELAPLLERVLC
jgi:serine/threonine protein kinase